MLVNEFDSIEQSVKTSKHDLDNIPFSANSLLLSRLANLNTSISSNDALLKRVGKSIDEHWQELAAIQEIISPRAAAKSIVAHKNRSHYALLRATRDSCDFSPRFDQFIEGFSAELARIRYLKRQMDIIGARILNNTMRIYLPEYHTSNAYIQPNLIDLAAFRRNVSLVQESARSMTAKARQLIDRHLRQNRQSNELNDKGDIEIIKTDLQLAQLSIGEANRKLAGFESSMAKVMATHGLAGDISQTLNSDTVEWIKAANHLTKTRWSSALSEVAKLELSRNGDETSIRQQLVGVAIEVNKAFDEALPKLRELRHSLDKDSLDDVVNLKSRTETLLKDVRRLRDKSSNLAIIRRETRELIEQTRLLNSRAN